MPYTLFNGQRDLALLDDEEGVHVFLQTEDEMKELDAARASATDEPTTNKSEPLP
jgi:hypothetical protein